MKFFKPKYVVFILLFLLPVIFQSSQAQASDKGIPVLMYHSIGDMPNNPAILSTSKFKEQMTYLYKNGYTPLSLDQLNSYLTKPSYNLPKKPILITFDDGYRDTYSTALPVLSNYKFKSTLFLVANKVNKQFSLIELKKMQAQGMAIYSHTLSHPDLNKLSAIKQTKEITEADKILSVFSQAEKAYFCYPYGHYNSTILKLLKKYNYKLAFTNKAGWVKKGDNPFLLKRIYIGNNISLSTFKERIQNPNYSH